MPDFIGPYEIRGELGRGAMAVVWRSWDAHLEREVAIKEPVLPHGTEPGVAEELSARFVREGRAAAGLNHPGIVTIFAADVYAGRPAIVMEVIEGDTLTSLLENGALPPSAALAIIDQLLDAVAYAHARGVVHRDVKPDNVFVTADGRVKLTDFGIAQTGTGATLTQAGTVLGTPGYMAPEQVTGDSVGAQADLFAVGVIAYELLTGSNPFGASADTLATTVMYRIVHEPTPAIAPDLLTSLPNGLTRVLEVALAKDPLDRFADAGAFRTALAGGPIRTGVDEALGTTSAAPKANGLVRLADALWKVVRLPPRRADATGKTPHRPWTTNRLVTTVVGVLLVLALAAGAGWYELVYMSPVAYAQRFVRAALASDTNAVRDLDPAAFSDQVEEAVKAGSVGELVRKLLPDSGVSSLTVARQDSSSARISIGAPTGDDAYLDIEHSGLGWKVKSTSYKTTSKRAESFTPTDQTTDDGRLPSDISIVTSTGSAGTKTITEEVATENGVNSAVKVVGDEVSNGGSPRTTLRGTGSYDYSMGVSEILVGTRSVNFMVQNPSRRFSTSTKPISVTLVLSGYTRRGDLIVIMVSPSGQVHESSSAHEVGGRYFSGNGGWTWTWDRSPFTAAGTWYVVGVVDGNPACSTTVEVQ